MYCFSDQQKSGVAEEKHTHILVLMIETREEEGSRRIHKIKKTGNNMQADNSG